MTSSFSAVPHDIDNPEVLRGFLQRLVEQIDVTLSNRGTIEGTVNQETLRQQPSVSSVGRLREEQDRALSARIRKVEQYLGI